MISSFNEGSLILFCTGGNIDNIMYSNQFIKIGKQIDGLSEKPLLYVFEKRIRTELIMGNYVEDDNKGYVIRCVNRDTGRVHYRGSNSKYTRQKDTLSPKDTYTFTGAKKALSNLERLHPDGSFYSIEKLSCYYDDFDSDIPDKKDYREKIFADIEHAMVRLDELWEGNDFHRGDKMRINEVRAVLRRIKEKLLDQQ